MTKAARWLVSLGIGLAVACGDGSDATDTSAPAEGADGVTAQPDASVRASDDAAPPGDPDWMNGGEDTPEYSLGRLLIARADAPELVLFDLDTVAIAGRLPFAQDARVYAGSGGRYGYAVDSTGGTVRIVEPGQWLLSHIDHFHVIRGAHALLSEQLDHGGQLAAYDGWITVIDPQTGRSSVFQERSITAKQFVPAHAALGAGAGAGIVAHAQLLATARVDGDLWITQHSAVAPERELAPIARCSAPGEVAAHGAAVYFTCEEGLVRLTFQEPTRSFAASIVRAGFDARPQRVRVAPRFAGAVVDTGAHSLAIVHEGAAPATVTFAREVLDFAVHRTGKVAVVLTGDGVMHEVSLAGGSVRRHAEVIAPREERADASDAPRLALSHAYAYVADVRRRDVPALRLRSFMLERQLPVDGVPADLAVVGMPPQYTDERE